MDSRRRVLAAVAAVVVLALVLAAVGSGLLSPSATSTASSSLTSSSGLNAPPALCTDFTPQQELADARVANGTAAAAPDYLEQFWLAVDQNFTSLSYNVTLRGQNDSLGFGPAYLLNGLTSAGMWYQVGIGWDLPSGSSQASGFQFLYEVWDTSTSSPVYPGTGGPTLKSFAAYDGDTVLLGLSVASGQVSLTAYDWNTSARANATYGALGASGFLGFQDKSPAFPTSLLTEWYHALPYYCSEDGAAYSNEPVALASAQLRIDEWNLTGTAGAQAFGSTGGGVCCVFSTGYQGVSFEDPATYQPLTVNGTTVYANAHEFVTP